MPSGARMSIGEVLELLRGEFPSISHSKIRYLETEGLVEPERTASGYRKFTHRDVERLRYVLVQQRDRYLPLREIRRELEQLDRGAGPVTAGADVPAIVLADDGFPRPDAFRRPRQQLRLSREELVAAAGVAPSVLEEIESYGLLPTRDAHAHYDGLDLMVVTLVGELTQHGLEPRHLRGYKQSADREVGLFEQILSTRRRHGDPRGPAQSEETVRELAALSVRLHATLVRLGLRDQTD